MEKIIDLLFVISIILMGLLFLVAIIGRCVTKKKASSKDMATPEYASELQAKFTPSPTRKTPNQIRAEYGFPPIINDPWNTISQSPIGILHVSDSGTSAALLEQNDKIKCLKRHCFELETELKFSEAELKLWKKSYTAMDQSNNKLHVEIDRLKTFEEFANCVSMLPNCNDCDRKMCKFQPKCGENVRFNCPIHIKRAISPSINMSDVGVIFVKEN